MPQPKINLMNKFQLCLSRWLVARTLKMNFAPPNLGKFKLFWGTYIFLRHMPGQMLWSTYTRGGVFLSKSKSIIFLSFSEPRAFGCDAAPKLLLSAAAAMLLPISMMLSVPRTFESHQKKYIPIQNALLIFILWMCRVSALTAHWDNVIPKSSSSVRRKFLSYSWRALTVHWVRAPFLSWYAAQPVCRVTVHINNC